RRNFYVPTWWRVHKRQEVRYRIRADGTDCLLCLRGWVDGVWSRARASAGVHLEQFFQALVKYPAFVTGLRVAQDDRGDSPECQHGTKGKDFCQAAFDAHQLSVRHGDRN